LMPFHIDSVQGNFYKIIKTSELFIFLPAFGRAYILRRNRYVA
jgi:hypothetical protein